MKLGASQMSLTSTTSNEFLPLSTPTTHGGDLEMRVGSGVVLGLRRRQKDSEVFQACARVDEVFM